MRPECCQHTCVGETGTWAPYVDLRHFGSGSGADEASSSIRGCEGVESIEEVSWSLVTTRI